MVKRRKFSYILLIILYLSNFGYKEVFAQTEKTFECKATYYHNMFENRRTSSGEIFTQKKYTAAHKTLPMHTLVKVTNLSNGRSVLVKVNDRCPKKGVIDLSSKAAKQILLHKTGTAKVKVEILEDDYLDILNQQDEIFAKFDKENLLDSSRNSRFDSILSLKSSANNTAFAFSHYVRLCSINNLEDLDNIIEHLPINYKNIIRTEKVLNADYYYVNIGPFSDINLAEQALKDLKITYKSAYIVKKK